MRRIKRLMVSGELMLAICKGAWGGLGVVTRDPLPEDARIVGASSDWRRDLHFYIESESFERSARGCEPLVKAPSFHLQDVAVPAGPPDCVFMVSRGEKLLGLYTDEEKAIAACTAEDDCVTPVRLNRAAEAASFGRYPLREGVPQPAALAL